MELNGELTLVAINDKVLTGEERRRAPVAREAAGVLIKRRDFHPLLLQNTKGTQLLGDFMCLQYIHIILKPSLCPGAAAGIPTHGQFYILNWLGPFPRGHSLKMSGRYGV
jgi:hypothetical protein